MIKFITGNKNKFIQVQKSLRPLEIEQLHVHLDEIQEIDPKKIIEHKVREAFKHEHGEFIVEDVSLYLECFDYKLPGPLIRWFNETLGNVGLFELTKKMGKSGAKLSVIIAYAKDENDIQYFEEEITGQIVEPKGETGFGFDPILLPDGATKTRGEMDEVEYLKFSARNKVAQNLKNYLTKNHG